MNGVVCTVQADAVTFSAAMDVRRGYPSFGVNIGQGIHASRAQGRTLRHGDVIRHPSLARWRYPADEVVSAELAAGLQIPASGSIQVLDPTWFP